RLDSDCSEARTASGFHTIPVTCCSFVKRMAATMGFVASTCALNAFENCTSWFGLSVIWQLLSILDNARIGKFRRLRLSAKLLVWTRPFARVAERCIKAIDGDLACPFATAPSTMAVSRLVAILQTAIDVRLPVAPAPTTAMRNGCVTNWKPQRRPQAATAHRGGLAH